MTRAAPRPKRRSPLRRRRCLRRRRGPVLAGWIGEETEEVGIRPQHHAGVAVPEALLIRLHRAIEGEEVRILAERLGEDAVAFGIALAADLLALGLRIRQKHRHVAVGASLNLLLALGAVGAELGG